MPHHSMELFADRGRGGHQRRRNQPQDVTIVDAKKAKPGQHIQIGDEVFRVIGRSKARRELTAENIYSGAVEKLNL